MHGQLHLHCIDFCMYVQAWNTYAHTHTHTLQIAPVNFTEWINTLMDGCVLSWQQVLWVSKEYGHHEYLCTSRCAVKHGNLPHFSPTITLPPPPLPSSFPHMTSFPTPYTMQEYYAIDCSLTLQLVAFHFNLLSSSSVAQITAT